MDLDDIQRQIVEDWNLHALHGGNVNEEVIVVEADQPPDPPRAEPPPPPPVQPPPPAAGERGAGPLLYGRQWRQMYIEANQGILPFGIPQPQLLRHVLVDYCINPNGEWFCLRCFRRRGMVSTVIRHVHQVARIDLLYHPTCPVCDNQIVRTWDIRVCFSCCTTFISNMGRVNDGTPIIVGTPFQ